MLCKMFYIFKCPPHQSSQSRTQGQRMGMREFITFTCENCSFKLAIQEYLIIKNLYAKVIFNKNWYIKEPLDLMNKKGEWFLIFLILTALEFGFVPNAYHMSYLWSGMSNRWQQRKTELYHLWSRHRTSLSHTHGLAIDVHGMGSCHGQPWLAVDAWGLLWSAAGTHA